MESKILCLIDFDLSFCSALGFYERFSKVLRVDERSYFLGLYLIELIQVE